MAPPTRLLISPTLSDNSTVVLSTDRDRPSGSPDHGEHAPTISDLPRSPRHPGPAGSFPLPGSTDQVERIPAVLDRPGFSSQLDPVGPLPVPMGSPACPLEPITPLTSSTPLGACGSGTLATSGPFRGSTPIVDTTSMSREFPPMTFVLRWRRSRIYGIERPHSAAKRIPSTRFSSHTERLLLAEIACNKRSTLCTDRPSHLFLSFSVVTT